MPWFWKELFSKKEEKPSMFDKFEFTFTEEMVRELLAGNNDAADWYKQMCEVLPKYDINTVERVAGFIAQCSHESRDFNVLTENLNYSASALNKIFPKYFERAGRDASRYHRQPEKIANVIYANRMGNGDVYSGMGWMYRGGGILQLTGFNNYEAFAASVGITPRRAVEYVRTRKGALESACWFWRKNNLNRYCDRQDIVGMSKRINGGTHGLDDRKVRYLHAIDVLGGNLETSEINLNVVLKEGSRNPTVALVQEKLGIASDGIYGPGTARAVKRWQKKNNLVADGIVGPNTIAKLLGD
jgi:putative chitinase